jgi:hypothetical protein
MTSPSSWPTTRSTARRRSRYNPDYRRALKSQNRNGYLTGNPSPACARELAKESFDFRLMIHVFPQRFIENVVIVLELCAVRWSKTVFRNKPKKGGFVFGDGLRAGSAGFIGHTHPLFLTQHRKVPTRVTAIEGDDHSCVCVHSVVSEVFC